MSSNKQSAMRSSLSVKLSLMSAAILIVVFSLYAFLSSRDLITAIDEQYKGKALAIIKTLDSTVNDKATLTHDLDHIQQVCDELVEVDPDILKVSLYVLEDNGKIIRIASSNHDQIGQEAEPHDVKPITTGKIIWEEKLEHEKGHVVEILAPIYTGKDPVASLGVYMDLAPKDAAIKYYMLHAIIYALSGLLSVALLLYLSVRRELFKPLWHLTEGTREIAKGNLNKRINLERKDELGELSKEFDNMADSLQAREEENRRLLEVVKEKWADAETRAQIDYLTNLDNHRTLQDKLDSEISRALREGVPVSLIFCDLDEFKGFNDTNGHLLGDKALFELAGIITSSIRDYDTAARYGGDEFAIVLPGADPDEAMDVAERIRLSVEKHEFTTKYGAGQMTISLGIATVPVDATNKKDLIAAADVAMYESKKSSKNSITSYNCCKSGSKTEDNADSAVSSSGDQSVAS